MAKYKGLNYIYPKDVTAMKLLSKTGAISQNCLNQLGISNTRIKNMTKSIIREVSYPSRHGCGLFTSFQITSSGKSLLKEIGITKFISNGGQATFHNQALSTYLVNNLTKEELDSCRSEREIPALIEDLIKECFEAGDYSHYEELVEKANSKTISMPDIAYINSEGELIFVEVITPSYGKPEIASKIETAQLFDSKIIFVKAT